MTKTNAMPRGVSRALEYIDTNIGERITLDELARVAFMSQFHFSRRFAKCVGKSPMRYVCWRRIDVAKRLLRDQSIKLGDVAYRCGFSSQSHFNEAFKRHTGVTPGAFRRELIAMTIPVIIAAVNQLLAA
jgi:AraC family transcriptional regulator